MAKKETVVYCEQEKHDCFAFCKGGCTVLTDTHFTKPCPFYKTMEQIVEERKKFQKSV